MENLKKTVSDLENKCETLIAELNARDEAIEKCQILRRFAFQTERTICQIVFGKDTRCRTLKTLLRQVKGDTLANDKWINLQEKLKWDAYTYQILEDLKENCTFVAHLANYKNESTTEGILLNIIKERYKDELDQNILKTFIELLKEHGKMDGILNGTW